MQKEWVKGEQEKREKESSESSGRDSRQKTTRRMSFYISSEKVAKFS